MMEAKGKTPARGRTTTVIEGKRKRLETKGWKIGSTRDFLDLSDQEEPYL